MQRRRLIQLGLLGAAGLGLAGCGAASIATTEGPADADVIGVARANGLRTLVDLLETAEMTDTLESEGPFTLLAPTNAAFSALPSGRLSRLRAASNRDDLRRLLAYHVIPGKITSSFLTGIQNNHVTAEGRTVSIDGRTGLTVNDASIIRPDLEASNGVVHVIDRVLSPS